MKQRDVFYKFPCWLQLICLFLLMFGCLLVCANMASLLVVLVSGADSAGQTLPLLFVQGASVTGGFLLPSLWFMHMQKAGNPDYISVKKGVGLKILGLAVLAYLLLCPFISAIQEWNMNWHFPERWQALEAYFRNKGLLADQLSRQMLQTDSWGVFICSLLVVAVGAGVCEEFFFRGCLQNIFRNWFKNTHAAVWVCAAVFSLFHGDLFGFLPRLFLGAFLGYLYVWSGSIWTSVIVHTLNNSLLAFVYFLNYNGHLALSPENLENAPHWLIVLPCLLLCTGTCLLLSRNAK
ncbi:MAG: CPBP family intramembrane metalloprotease [Bacteroides sp.]|nr:CPBP family intramembrane metalloprotease [Bacteroides sp.]MCM1084723.1 CPBP family intramembrane metalloprotease [Bacteroides sp.]